MSDVGQLEQDIRTTVLRPLADKFQELTRKVDSGEYEMPKTIGEARAITEGYIDQAWERLRGKITYPVDGELQAEVIHTLGMCKYECDGIHHVAAMDEEDELEVKKLMQLFTAHLQAAVIEELTDFVEWYNLNYDYAIDERCADSFLQQLRQTSETKGRKE